mgnify:CR=1 FL=1
MSIRTEVWGKSPKGKDVHRFTLTNAMGASISVIEWGAILQSIIVPDAGGNMDDIALGFDENGIELSRGQKQKIAIVRAEYKDSPIFIMDEPTASLDVKSENKLYSSLNTEKSEKIKIFISHRLSSCKFCQKIIVLENGTIVENGNHKQLMQKKSVYYKLFNEQALIYKKPGR